METGSWLSVQQQQKKHALSILNETQSNDQMMEIGYSELTIISSWE